MNPASADWLHILLGGTFEVALPMLKLVQGASAEFRGSGRVVWQGNAEVRVLAATDGAEALIEGYGRSGVTLGQLVPHETFVSATGRTQEGWDASTSPVPLDGYKVHGDSPHVIWDFASPGLSLSRPTPQGAERRQRVLRGVLGPPPKDWIRATETEVRNEYFGGRSWKLDWLQARTSFGLVAARQRSDQWFEVQIAIDRTPPRGEGLEILWAVARAFGFILGRRLVIRGFEDLLPDLETRNLAFFDREPTKNSLPLPLGSGSAYRDHVEVLLGRAIDFFMTERGEQVARHLYLCWDTADDAFPTRLAVAGICVEALLRMAAEGSEDSDRGYTERDKAAIEEWLTANNASLSKRFVKRLRGFIGALDHRRPVDILWEWQRSGRLGVTAEDIYAWEKTRNPAAHGSLAGRAPERTELQLQLSRLYRVFNLMNRIVLELIGFEGQYVDYSKPNWPEGDFPPAPPSPGP